MIVWFQQQIGVGLGTSGGSPWAHYRDNCDAVAYPMKLTMDHQSDTMEKLVHAFQEVVEGFSGVLENDRSEYA
jgi:hypothetical protein